MVSEDYVLIMIMIHMACYKRYLIDWLVVLYMSLVVSGKASDQICSSVSEVPLHASADLNTFTLNVIFF